MFLAVEVRVNVIEKAIQGIQIIIILSSRWNLKPQEAKKSLQKSSYIITGPEADAIVTL